jgi:predicted Rossmann fold flavoprotein
LIKRDVVVIGAGAAGLFCAAQAGQRGRSVTVVDHAKKIGRKILMSGGGRCNFTNMYASPENFLCANPHFCKSALSRYTQWDFIGLVAEHGIDYHEKTLGQLFCDDSASQIVDLLVAECAKADVTISTRCEITSVSKLEQGFMLQTSQGDMLCESLVIATGGLSLPKLGATGFGYQIAKQFGLNVLPTRAGLVPFTLQEQDKTLLAELSGVAIDTYASCNNVGFRENTLFTHRGLSGPAMLQVSSFWHPGDSLHINTAPSVDMLEGLSQEQRTHPDALLVTCLSKYYPKRVAATFCALNQWENKPIKQYSSKEIEAIANFFLDWQIKPNGTEGYRTAEVTLGGVDTDELSSKTMMAKNVEGLFFIGEVMDVTGWLGGFNFQWAWSSGWAAGQYV